MWRYGLLAVEPVAVAVTMETEQAEPGDADD